MSDVRERDRERERERDDRDAASDGGNRRPRDHDQDDERDDRREERREREGDKHREKERKRKRRSRDESSDESSSESDDDVSRSASDSDSESDSSEDERRRRKRRKKEKRDKERRKEKKKDKKRKKDKDRKKKKKKDKGDKDTARAGAVTDQWGKFGQLVETDLWRKRPEFQLWLMEVKQKTLEELSNWEEKQLFRDYMEDYNTATLPHRKYYSLQDYEAEKAKKPPKKRVEEPSNVVSFDDERSRKEEIRKIRDARAREAQQEAFAGMDEEKVAAMRRQQGLKNQMQTLFKMGRYDEAEKIQKLLQPDEK
ncbi:unnamed protein product [Vitrella brassicaformis CCMP3155]|uniref:Uncharacterized protein n=2 Tax=Vitrella brassicaformis TaxID=1169539 RepID=A0A0G4GHE2_VITBC|nr:unnamed protein product [Vitrella brassicaformis CCMP3155]|mmetsp:Transcript_1770/g.3850  ORF Transcript_1770/g.3850 Transcript_1770/m.3850 type:complete len:311 (+) Transcript_1770:127-1059(+)|eukprot:CEM29155.1 unnamed protein product [Vitrella brassicaformis CCMP3155]